MQTFDVYEDIAKRTGGDIYIGVVGPVRTGKSTLIQRLLSELVIPGMPPSSFRSVLSDEIPQSSEGKTVMTTEPKFIPGEAVRVRISDGAEVNLRMIDCVGFAVEGANGFEEDGKPRYIRTPWSEEPLPFAQAASLGTERVIREHSTIGIMVTTDGSFTDLSRAAYEKAEERAIEELKAIGKPFVAVLNTADPAGAEELRLKMEEKYNCPVLALDVLHLSAEGIREILRAALFEFPLLRADIVLPAWMQVLPADSEAIGEILTALKALTPKVAKLKDCLSLQDAFADEKKWKVPFSLSLFPAEGRAECAIEAQEGVFFEALSRECGETIEDDCKLMAYVKALAESKKGYDRIRGAFAEAEETGYGIVMPEEEEMELSEPKLVKSGPHYGAKIRASAPGYHIVKVEVTGEVSQILGTQAQGQSFVSELQEAYKEGDILSVDVFGKSVNALVTEELERKSAGMPPEVKRKLKRAIRRVVNEGKSNVICLVF